MGSGHAFCRSNSASADECCKQMSRRARGVRSPRQQPARGVSYRQPQRRAVQVCRASQVPTCRQTSCRQRRAIRGVTPATPWRHPTPRSTGARRTMKPLPGWAPQPESHQFAALYRRHHRLASVAERAPLARIVADEASAGVRKRSCAAGRRGGAIASSCVGTVWCVGEDVVESAPDGGGRGRLDGSAERHPRMQDHVIGDETQRRAPRSPKSCCSTRCCGGAPHRWTRRFSRPSSGYQSLTTLPGGPMGLFSGIAKFALAKKAWNMFGSWRRSHR